MLKSSIKFNEAFEENVRKIYARVTIGDKSFTEADIFTIDFESGSVNGPGYQIGSVFSDLVKIKFDKVIRDLKELDKVIVEIGIEREKIEASKQPIFNSKVKNMRIGVGKLNKIFYDNPIEYVRLGTFYISEHADINENDQTTTITCMDAVIYFEQQYKPAITFPADIFDISMDVANQIGIQMDFQSFLKLPNKTISKPDTLTCRQLIGYISQFACGFIKISKYGLLELKTPKDTEKIIDSTSYYQKGLSKNDLKYRVDGVLCRNQLNSKEILSGSSSGSQLIINNPFVNQKDLDYIFSQIKDVEYYPFSLQWYGIPSIEAGDWLVVKDNEGNQFRVPNLSYKLHYNGGLKATSSAETQSQSSELNIFESPLNREIARINKEVVSTKENSVLKNNIIEQINISEEKHEGDYLKIIGNKISINSQSLIEENSIDGKSIKGMPANRIIGNTSEKELNFDFDNSQITSLKSDNSFLKLSNGDIELNNASNIYQKIDGSVINEGGKIDIEMISKHLFSLEVSMFDIDDKENVLGVSSDNDLSNDNIFVNETGAVSQNQLIMGLLVMVKKLNKEVLELKKGG